MRVLFTCVGGPGHLNPALPVTTAVQAAGHDVLWAVSPSARSLVVRAGFPVRTLGARSSRDLVRGPLLPVDATRADDEVRENFARAATAARVPLLGPLLRQWRPDVVVCDEFDFSAMLAAELAGVRYATVLVTATGRQLRPEVVAEPLHAARAGLGLPPDPDLRMLTRHLVLNPFPPSLRGPEVPVPDTERAFAPDPPPPPGPRPDWAAPPAVYFTLGTEFGLESGDLYERVLAGLGQAPVHAMVTVGSLIDPAEFGPQPGHLRVERYVPQDQVLPHCAAVLSHGGSGSVTGALAHGLPSVLLPLGADQPRNAERCVELGVAVALDADTATPAEIRAALAEVLTEPVYRRRAAAIAAELTALPPASSVVEALLSP